MTATRDGFDSRTATADAGSGDLAGSRHEAGLVLAVGIAEGALVLLILGIFGANLALLSLAHGAVLALLATRIRSARRQGQDASNSLLALIATAAIGPAGAIGAGLLGLLSGRAAPNDLLEAWYERISLSVAVDPVTRLCDDVGVGRTIDLGGPTPASFHAVVETGTLAERQTVLGLIARRFHADYLPVLRAALQSPEPMIRVQAAAVAAHVRPDVTALFREAVASVPAASGTPGTALALLGRIEAFTASGLLDESDRLHGLALRSRLGDVVLAGLCSGGLRLPGGSGAGRAGARDTLERLLMDRHRFAELRAQRNEGQALGRRPRARVRKLGGEAQP